MAPETSTAEPQLFLENLELGLTGTIVLMFYRMWDVYAAMGHYLSTDFVVCDSKGTTMHATARSAIAHNFLKLKEDAAGYVTNVGWTVQQKTGSKTLDFHLANSSETIQHTSSTLILDDEEIPELKELKADSSGAKFSKEMPSVGCLEAKAGTLENLLIYRLELEVSDDIAEGDDHSPLPQALANIMWTSHTLEFKSHTYYEHNTYESFTCWRIVTAEGMGDNEGSSMAGVSRASKTPEFKRLLRHPSVTTLSKVDEGKKHKRVEAEGSDAEASFVADTQTSSAMGGSRPDTRKIKRRVVDDNAMD
ncbi:hypothetical protein Tco_0721213 [Tanacetum coccineum]